DVEVHEVLCVDADGDGSYDYSTTACDYTTPNITNRGSIVSTVAPYTGTNVYVYVLTDTAGTALETSYTGYFTGLEDAEYNVFAYTFLSAGDAAAVIDSITIGTTDMDAFSVTQPACYGFCGDVEGKTGSYYDVSCELTIVAADIDDAMVCEDGDVDIISGATTTGSLPDGDSIAYVWEVDSGSGFVSATSTQFGDTLGLTNVQLADDGNEYRAIAILYINGVEIDRDTSDTGTLSVYEDPVMASNLDTTVNSGSPNGVIFTDATSTADSFVLVSITPSTTEDFAPGSGNVSTGSTTNTAFISGDTYDNTSGTPQTVTYRVIPFSSEMCEGDTVDIIVTVVPCPDVDAITAVICSDDLIGVSLPSSDMNGASIDSFIVTSTTTGATTGTTTSTSFLSSDSFTNETASDITVTYTVTPYAYGCEGSSFTVTVTVKPVPVVTYEPVSVCSDEEIGINLIPSGYAGASIDSFIVTADVNGLSGTASTGTFTEIDTIASDVFTNTSLTMDSVVYSVIPYADSCAGASYDIVVRILREPVGTDPTPMVCSDEALDITLQDQINMPGGSFSWFAESNTDVTGETTTTSSNSEITDILTNVTSSDQTVTYRVIPTAGTCVGDTFAITVTVKPEPVFNDTTYTACSGEELDIDLSATLTNGLSIDGYTYTVVSDNDTDMSAESARTDTLSDNITHTYVNTTASPIDVTYTVTPISNDDCGGDTYTITVTIDPEPTLADDLDDVVCSDDATGVTLAVASGSVAADSYNIVSITSNGLSNSATTPATTGVTTDTDAISDDTWTNSTTDTVDVVYAIAPISADGCIGDTVDVTIRVAPVPEVEAGSSQTLCSTGTLTLSDLGASISGTASAGTWSTSGSGSFEDGSGGSDSTFAGAVTYVPSQADIESGGVTLTLSPSGGCDGGDDTVFITINNVSCGTFPWTGN
ncbi:MAG: PKD-like domain-containing protein, partial [Bacteroidota bacterium]